MLDVAVAYNRYQFLGEEFLTWLWYVIEKDQNLIKNFDKDFVALEIGNRIVFENRRKESGERITIKGDGASLEEGILALKKGALVTELNIVYKSAELTWQFTLKGESLNFSSLQFEDLFCQVIQDKPLTTGEGINKGGFIRNPLQRQCC